ncbi:hypothetical protein DAPPUDRAFT_316049 [Daphnia pulex]|uniref:Uncharacterized protein n=1 Tax=Daphnia pulex TaxID=6669 RepID=E9GBJ5_DAPPU|nr:hypothetical protein DAPPUDRAFT_316049 [Daphnia pulex]|eukprot:EFX83139.1 hypothetical protein DAPPUDRAFT_316049 [Daphnia pulex]
MVFFYQNIMKQLAVATQSTTPSADDMEVDHDSDDDEKMEVDNDDGQNGRGLKRKRDATWIIPAKTTAKRPSKKIRSSPRVKCRRVAVVATWKKPNARMRKICRTINWPTSPVIETKSKTSNAEAMEVDCQTFPDIPACQLIVKSFYDATFKDFRRRYARRNKGTLTERMEVD